MWIDDSSLQTIRETRPDSESVEQLLAEILNDRPLSEDVPRACPTCHEGLIVRSEVGLAVRTCAAGHGAWLSTADVSFLRAGAVRAKRAARRRRWLVSMSAVLSVALLMF